MKPTAKKQNGSGRARAKTSRGRTNTGKRAVAPHADGHLRQAGNLCALAAVGAHTGVLVLMMRDGVLPAWLAVAFALLAMAAFTAYARDKRAAQRETRRTPEFTLHMLELAGGWPGALLAQRALRHKNRKVSYQFAFWACVLLHEAVLVHLWRIFSI